MDLKDYQNSGRLNLSGFTDLNKSAIPYNEFVENYVTSGKYEIYSEATISNFKKSIKDELVKGEFGAVELKKANSELDELKHLQYISKGTDVAVGVYVREKIEKSTEEETTEDLEKGVVTESFGSYSNNKLSFHKTGKEIKTQITTVLLPLLEAQKLQLETQLALCIKDITLDPDSNVDSWDYRGFANVLPKVGMYSWNLMESKDSSTGTEICTEEDRKCMRKYNDCARMIVSTMADIQYSNILARNVEDAKKYELSSDQILALQF